MSKLVYSDILKFAVRQPKLHWSDFIYHYAPLCLLHWEESWIFGPYFVPFSLTFWVTEAHIARFIESTWLSTWSAYELTNTCIDQFSRARVRKHKYHQRTIAGKKNPGQKVSELQLSYFIYHSLDPFLSKYFSGIINNSPFLCKIIRWSLRGEGPKGDQAKSRESSIS